MRIKFEKGKQREFIQLVLEKINSPFLSELASRMQISYSTLKNYFSEKRLLPENFFEDLLFISKINKEDLEFKKINENWGQVLGGKKGK